MKQAQQGVSTEETKEETVSSTDEFPTRPSVPLPYLEQTPYGRFIETASQAVDGMLKSASAHSKRIGSFSFIPTDGDSPCNYTTPKSADDVMALFFGDSCSPCGTPTTDSPDRRRCSTGSIRRTVTTDACVDQLEIPEVRSTESGSSPNSQKGRGYLDHQLKPSQTNTSMPTLSSANVPMKSLMVESSETFALERSISELTMKSSYGEERSKLVENRRMAYYAVGKHHKHSGRGGNRRCYFTGKLILGGAPFYAGSVQQGLRTLVVFCLPSAIGLPKGVEVQLQHNLSSAFVTDSGVESIATSRDSSHVVLSKPRLLKPDSLLKRSRSRSLGANSTGGSTSRISSLDDVSLSLEHDLDPNWGLDRDFLLAVLPEPSQDVLDEMSKRFPEQFETLPIQVRSPHCWRLYVKFCFFSGLPIAEGELHYRVKDTISSGVNADEIILSHEVMEAVNGESAEILRLPNLKTFCYLRRHYTQQSGKLADIVFRRTSWEMVCPEV